MSHFSKERINELVDDFRKTFGPAARCQPGYQWSDTSGVVIWTGEDAFLKDGSPCFAPYSTNYDKYPMGVHRDLEVWATKNGLFWEAHDGGTLFAYKA